MDEMNITSAQYENNRDGNKYMIVAVINGTTMHVPLAPGNRHYDAIMKAIAAGELTIADAD